MSSKATNKNKKKPGKGQRNVSNENPSKVNVPSSSHNEEHPLTRRSES
jgi:hypothetical protein